MPCVQRLESTSTFPSNQVLYNGNTNKAVYGTIVATTGHKSWVRQSHGVQSNSAAAMPSCFGDGSLGAYAELDYKPAANWDFHCDV